MHLHFRSGYSFRSAIGYMKAAHAGVLQSTLCSQLNQISKYGSVCQHHVMG